MKDFKRHNPFITPAGYFDQFAVSIMQQVAQMPMAAVRPARSMVRRIQMWVSYAGIAAVVALVFIVGQGENGELTSGTSGAASVPYSTTPSQRLRKRIWMPPTII